MSTVTSPEALIEAVEASADAITATLTAGRADSVPLEWSWRLFDATPAERRNFRIIGSGQGVHWPDIDEDISLHGMLHGIRAIRPAK